MAGGWNVCSQIGQAQDLGTVAASSSPAGVSPGSTAYTKGAWTQLTSSLPCDCNWVMAEFYISTSSNYNRFDIGIGPSGSEIAVVSNLYANSSSFGYTMMLPLSIQSASRVSMRVSSDSTVNAGRMKLTMFDDRGGLSTSSSIFDTYGFNTTTANAGIKVDAGSVANTKGAWSEITSALTYDICGFFVVFDGQFVNAGVNSFPDILVDVGIGPSGSEQVILPNFYTRATYYYGAAWSAPGNTAYIPMPIRAGTRVAARCQSNDTTASNRVLGVTFYGARQ